MAVVKAQKLPGGKVKVMLTVDSMADAVKVANRMGVKKNPACKKNIEQGYWTGPPSQGGVFHPIRKSSDYRAEALRGREGEIARSGVATRKRKKAIAKKRAVKKAAKKTVKRKKK